MPDSRKMPLTEHYCPWPVLRKLALRGGLTHRGHLVGGGARSAVLCSRNSVPTHDSLHLGALPPLPHPLCTRYGILTLLPFLSPLFRKVPRSSASPLCAHGHAGHLQNSSSLLQPPSPVTDVGADHLLADPLGAVDTQAWPGHHAHTRCTGLTAGPGAGGGKGRLQQKGQTGPLAEEVCPCFPAVTAEFPAWSVSRCMRCSACYLKFTVPISLFSLHSEKTAKVTSSFSKRLLLPPSSYARAASADRTH